LHNLVDRLTRLAPGESPLDNFTYKAVGLGCVGRRVARMAAQGFLRHH
jgi:hypothetical protein